MLSTLIGLCCLAAPPAPVSTLVVCPTEFREALVPWVEHRRKQGHQIEFVSSGLSADALQSEIRRRAAGGSLRYVVLVGDADPAMHRDPAVRARSVPTRQVPAKVIRSFGPEATIASDNGYADVDEDGVPDLAVGRLTADSPAQLAAIVEKILAYERNTNFGPWRRRVNFVAGIGGFGALADTMIEAAARRVIAAGVPAAYTTHMTYASWRSPYCPDPGNFRRAAITSLNEGSLCWVYMGHAWPARLADIQVPGGAHRSLDHSDLPHLRPAAGPPIACLLACYTGAFDGRDDCLAETMLVVPGGPVGVVCGSRVTMPYAMSVLGVELMRELFSRQPETLGDCLLGAKRQMLAPAEPDEVRSGLDALSGLLSPSPELAREELVEHVSLFNLIGDPTLRLRTGVLLTLDCAAATQAGRPLEIRGRSPIEGRCHIELVAQRGQFTFRPPVRTRYDSAPAARAELDQTYRRANDDAWQRVEVDVPSGDFLVRLAVPQQAHGSCHVRAFVEGAADFASGSAAVEITPVAANEP